METAIIAIISIKRMVFVLILYTPWIYKFSIYMMERYKRVLIGDLFNFYPDDPSRC